MEDLFVLRVILSFLIAGAWIGSTTLLAERLGSKIGGLFTNLPSNILISLVFVAIQNQVPYVIDMIPSIPVGMTIDTVFLFFFVVLLKYGLVLSTVVSLLIWALFAILATTFPMDNLLFNLLFYLAFTAVAFLVLEKVIRIPSAEKSPKSYSKGQMLIRAVFAGGMVASVLVISRFLNPYVVGIFSVFPAVLLSAMIILTINQSKAFARATGKVLVLSSTNIVVYGLAVYFTYPKLGIALGTLISFLVAFLWVLFFRPIVQRIK